MVYDNRPCHVSGLKFAVDKCVPFFNAYSTTIGKVDQWVRVLDSLGNSGIRSLWQDLLKTVGTLVRINQNTLLRLKGKFARVCLNIDITSPPMGSLTISRDGRSMRVPLIYEGLHKVCPLYGGKSH